MNDPTPEQFEADFDALWLSLDRNYAYFDVKQTDWAAVRSIYRPNARKVKTRAEFVGLLERVLEELYDPHTHLDTNTASSPRLVPSGTDLWAEWREAAALILEVRPGSPAAQAGLRPGMELVSYNGKAITEAVEARLGRSRGGRSRASRRWRGRSYSHSRPAGARTEASLERVRTKLGPAVRRAPASSQESLNGFWTGVHKRPLVTVRLLSQRPHSSPTVSRDATRRRIHRRFSSPRWETRDA